MAKKGMARFYSIKKRESDTKETVVPVEWFCRILNDADKKQKKMKKAYMFIAPGSEVIESLIPLDVLRRGGVDVKTVSITGNDLVEVSHGVTIKTDLVFEDADFADADLLMLPGGLAPGAAALNEHEGVRQAMLSQFKSGRLVSAICAAPMILGNLGIVRGKRATCYPGFEKYLEGAEYTHELCTVDGNVITGEGPAASLPYAYKLLEILTTEQNAHTVAEQMMYLHLMEK